MESLTHLFNLIWLDKKVCAPWRRGVIVTLRDCNSWRGFTLLSIPGKVFCSVLLQHLKDELGTILRMSKPVSEREGPVRNRPSLFATS